MDRTSDMLRSSSLEFFASDEQSGKDKHKKHKALQELTINKLNHQGIGLVGRENEVDALRYCLHRAAHQTRDAEKRVKKEFVVIQGYSGVGKSTIAETAHNYVKEISNNGTVVQGKFDQNAYEEPFSGISDVFSELCHKILEGIDKGDNGLISVKKSIEAELMSEMELLQRLIPSLSELASVGSDASPEENDNNYGAEFERLKYAFRVLTRLLCSHFSPLVLILDDLQWADTASLQTIDFLLSDTENDHGLVIIGLYRSNEVDETHLLTQTLGTLDSKRAMIGLNITRIEIESLGLLGVNSIIMSMLGIDDDGLTKGLAEICFRRTLGNPFFVIEFMTMLDMENMITFNLGLLKWTWDAKKIEERTMSTANVVDLLQAKMKRLPEKAQIVMHYAACLGAEFKMYALETILTERTLIQESDSIEVHSESFHDMLQLLQDSNFIEKSGSKSFRWVHDKVQEAVLSYGLALEPSFQYDVGLILFNNLSGHEFEEMLFEIVNLINKGRFKVRPDFAELNLRAAKKAHRMSAFHTAASYAKIGIKFLRENKWTDHSSLALSLYTIGAEVEVTLGNTNIAEEYIIEVLAQDRLTQLEKLPIYIAKSYKLINIDSKHKEALNFLCQTLKDFGYWVPLGVMQPFHALRVFRRVVKAAKKRKISSYNSPKLMTNPKDKAAMSLLSRIFYASYFTGKKFLMVFSVCQMVQMTINLGVSSLSAYAYATLGFVTTVALGDYKTSSFFAETAMVIQKSIPSKYMESQTLFLCCQCVFPWTKPIQSQLENLRRAHSLGMRSGNIEFALWCQHNSRLCSPWTMGKPLDLIISGCERIVPVMEDLKQSEHVWATRGGWQLALNLKGLVDNELVLDGQALKKVDHGLESKFATVLQAYFQSDLYLFFGQYKLAAESALERGEEFAEVIGSGLLMIETFHRAVALFAMAHKTRESKYLKPANRLLKRIAKWAQVNPNVKHYYHFLKAEQFVIKRNYKDAKTQYGEAIKIAARTGHLHHAGLFNERFADFYETILVDEEEACYRLKEAVRWYTQWGADLKVELLSAKLTRKAL